MNNSPGWPAIARRHRRLVIVVRFSEITAWLVAAGCLAGVATANGYRAWFAAGLAVALIAAGLGKALRRNLAEFEQTFASKLDSSA